MSSIVRRGPAPAQELVSVAQAHAELEASRRRVGQALSELERESTLGARVRAAVRAAPVLTLGGAFLVGWAVARLFPRRRKERA